MMSTITPFPSWIPESPEEAEVWNAQVNAHLDNLNDAELEEMSIDQWEDITSYSSMTKEEFRQQMHETLDDLAKDSATWCASEGEDYDRVYAERYQLDLDLFWNQLQSDIKGARLKLESRQITERNV